MKTKISKIIFKYYQSKKNAEKWTLNRCIYKKSAYSILRTIACRFLVRVIATVGVGCVTTAFSCEPGANISNLRRLQWKQPPRQCRRTFTTDPGQCHLEHFGLAKNYANFHVLGLVIHWISCFQLCIYLWIRLNPNLDIEFCF